VSSRVGAFTDPRRIQGNILITEEGNARLGDYGITGVITDPTVVEPGSTTTSKAGTVVRYMAPELLNPSQFSLTNSNPSKESDVFSFAMTTYEVSSRCTACTRNLHHRLPTRSSQRSYRMGTLGTASSSSGS